MIANIINRPVCVGLHPECLRIGYSRIPLWIHVRRIVAKLVIFPGRVDDETYVKEIQPRGNLEVWRIIDHQIVLDCNVFSGDRVNLVLPKD